MIANTFHVRDQFSPFKIFYSISQTTFYNPQFHSKHHDWDANKQQFSELSIFHTKHMAIYIRFN